MDQAYSDKQPQLPEPAQVPWTSAEKEQFLDRVHSDREQWASAVIVHYKFPDDDDEDDDDDAGFKTKQTVQLNTFYTLLIQHMQSTHTHSRTQYF